MRVALIANQRSGGATDPAEIAHRLAADGASVHWTAIEELTGERPGVLDPDGVAAGVRALSAAGLPERLVVAGGDGSMGLAARLAAELGVALAVVPVGTANDFARALDLPLEIGPACSLARAARSRTRHVELGEVAHRPFVNAASVGLSVIAARAAAALKPRLGAAAYAVGALRAGLMASPLRCRVTCDDEERFAGRAWQVIVGVTGAFGGGSELGGALPDDGLLDAAVIPAGSRVGLARRAYAMRRGRLTAQSDVPHMRARVVEVELPAGATFNVDGEVCRCEPPRFALRPGGFEVVVP